MPRRRSRDKLASQMSAPTASAMDAQVKNESPAPAGSFGSEVECSGCRSVGRLLGSVGGGLNEDSLGSQGDHHVLGVGFDLQLLGQHDQAGVEVLKRQASLSLRGRDQRHAVEARNVCPTAKRTGYRQPS